MGRLLAIRLAVMALLTFPALSAGAGEFDDWLAAFRVEALGEGISEATLNAALEGLKPLRRALRRDRNQAEKKLSFETYRTRVLKRQTIRKGRAMLAQHKELIDRVAARYGVQGRFIVAIWGIETRYGSVTGDIGVIPAVATLAFDKRRSSFFRKQLLAALKMIDKGHIDVAAMKGSWAGAMGQPQFIPTSYLAYAQDFDGDGRRDIWGNLGDVFASIANYLKQHGWSDRWTWGRPVRVPPEVAREADANPDGKAPGCRAMRSASRAAPLSEWQARGVRRLSGKDLPDARLSARLVLPDGPDGAAFLIYRNYGSILRYNCAHLYALTVGLLSDAIADGR